MNKIKYYAAVAASAPFMLLAQGTEGGGTTDIAQEIVDQASDTLTDMLSSAGGVIAGLVVAGLAVWGGIALVGVVKRAFSAGKGR